MTSLNSRHLFYTPRAPPVFFRSNRKEGKKVCLLKTAWDEHRGILTVVLSFPRHFSTKRKRRDEWEQLSKSNKNSSLWNQVVRDLFSPTLINFRNARTKTSVCCPLAEAGAATGLRTSPLCTCVALWRLPQAQKIGKTRACLDGRFRLQ